MNGNSRKFGEGCRPSAVAVSISLERLFWNGDAVLAQETFQGACYVAAFFAIVTVINLDLNSTIFLRPLSLTLNDFLSSYVRVYVLLC